jgi:hypothetical protein
VDCKVQICAECSGAFKTQDAREDLYKNEQTDRLLYYSSFSDDLACTETENIAALFSWSQRKEISNIL